MKKEWFLLIDGKEEGPFSIKELKRDRRITPDTLARKAGSDKWAPIKTYKELKELFKEQIKEEEEKEEKPPFEFGEAILDRAILPGPYLDLLILIIIITLLWLVYRVFYY